LPAPKFQSFISKLGLIDIFQASTWGRVLSDEENIHTYIASCLNVFLLRAM
jgi:hypothetical protein